MIRQVIQRNDNIFWFKIVDGYYKDLTYINDNIYEFELNKLFNTDLDIYENDFIENSSDLLKLLKKYKCFVLNAKYIYDSILNKDPIFVIPDIKLFIRNLKIKGLFKK